MTATSVRSIILGRISAGVYGVGDRLPSVRALAAELGVNRNTVGKAYLGLRREGLIRATRGSGAFVQRVPEHKRSVAEDQVNKLLSSAFSYAMLAGVSPKRLKQLIELQFRGVTRRQIAVAFVECNPYEAKEIALRMQHALGHPVAPMVLDKLPPTASLLRDFPVISTTLFHLGELQQKLRRTSARVIGLQHSPSPESVLEIARLAPGTPIGVVASNQRTLTVLLKLVETYHRSVVGTCFASDSGHVRELAKQVDVLVTHPLARRSISGELGIRVIEVTFQIEHQSLDYLRQHLTKLSTDQRTSDRKRKVPEVRAS